MHWPNAYTFRLLIYIYISHVDSSGHGGYSSIHIYGLVEKSQAPVFDH